MNLRGVAKLRTAADSKTYVGSVASPKKNMATPANAANKI